MRKSNFYLPALLLLLTAAAVTLPAYAAKADRVIEGSWPTGELKALRFDLSVAELEVTAGGAEAIEIEIIAECRDDSKECMRALEGLELSERTRGTTLMIDLEDYPKWGKGRLEIEAFVKIPANLDFELDMGVGEVDIEGLRGNLDLELGVGELTIDAKSKDLHSINLDVGVGEAEIYGGDRHVEGRRSFLVGSEVYWAEGKGDKSIKVDVGVGEATVRLD